MASAPTLSALEEIFRKNMNQRSLEFGGISVALCGDPAQLPPIMNKVIYICQIKGPFQVYVVSSCIAIWLGLIQ